MDYQAFLTNELRKAADSPDHEGELNLFNVHYHRAMLEALRELQLCPTCASRELWRLQLSAGELERREFGSAKELMESCKSRLRDTALLCPACKTAFQQDMMVKFFARRTQYDIAQKKKKEE
jgi:isopentenyldiphosphate isomerase